MKPGFTSTNLEHKEEISIQPEHQLEKIIQNNKDSIGCPWDNSKHTNIQIIGKPEREEEEQDTEKLTRKNNERELP